MLQAGKLDQRLSLRQPAPAKGASGGFTRGWVTLPPMWGAVRHLSGTERRATSAGGEVAEARTEITIPYRAEVTAQWSVLYQGRHYNIRHVNDFMARREFLILTCDTGVNDG